MFKKHSSFSFTALLFMPRLSEHELSGAIGMLKLAYVFLTSPDIIIATRQLYSASEIATRLLRQLKIDEGLVSQEWRLALRANLRPLCIDDIYIEYIRSGWLLSVSDE